MSEADARRIAKEAGRTDEEIDAWIASLGEEKIAI